MPSFRPTVVEFAERHKLKSLRRLGLTRELMDAFQVFFFVHSDVAPSISVAKCRNFKQPSKQCATTTADIDYGASGRRYYLFNQRRYDRSKLRICCAFS